MLVLSTVLVSVLGVAGVGVGITADVLGVVGVCPGGVIRSTSVGAGRRKPV